jgi:hypothetical protein
MNHSQQKKGIDICKKTAYSALNLGFNTNIVVLQKCVPVAQLDRASASEAEGCGFESRRERFTSR